MTKQPKRLIALGIACLLVMGATMPVSSFAAIPGGYYSVAVWPDVPGAFTAPGDVSVASSGDVYIADTSNCRIKRMTSAGALLGVWGSRGAGPGQFSDPQGVVALPSGRVVVADTGNNRLQLFEADGTYVATWGSGGTGNLQFSAPSGLGADTTGNIYVADSGNGRVQKLSSAGAWMLNVGAYGPANGQLDNPRDVAVDASGNIYVADTNNRRIEKFTAAGVYTSYWGPVEISGTTYSRYNAPSGIAIDSAGAVFVVDPGRSLVTPNDPLSAIYYVERCNNTGSTVYSRWGTTTGTGSGSFVMPRGIAARPGGGAYVADTGNNRVQVLSAAGAVDAIWTGRGTAPGALDTPQGVALDASGQAYVADTLNNRIQVFDTAGAFVRAFGSTGSGNGQFNAPTDVAIAPTGEVLVVEKGNNRVQVLTQTGTYVSKFGTAGSGNGQFSAPEGIGVDAAGNIFVADTGNARMQKFSSAGVYTSMIVGTVAVPLSAPVDVAIDGSDDIYLLDRTMARVRVYTSAAAYVRTIGSPGSTDGQFFQPTGVAVYGGSVYVTDSGNSRVQRITTAGVFETRFGTLGGGAGELSFPARAAIDASGRVLVVEKDNHRLQLFAYDGAAPSTSLSGFSNLQYYNAPVTMTLTATDGGSGVAATYYRVNGGAITPYTGPVILGTEGLNTVNYWSVDRSGNTEGSKLIRMTIDTVPPSGSFVVAGGATYVATTTVQAVGTFSDAVDMRFSTDGTWPTPFIAYESLVELTLPGEGTHVVRGQYRDIATNVATREQTVTVDLTAPSSSATVSPSGWANSAVTVSLSAEDSASGVDRIVYRLGAQGADTTYAGPFQIAAEGVTDIYFHAVDKVGNAESTQTATAYVDLTPPAGTLLIAGGEALVDTSTVTLESDVPDAVDMRVDAGSGFGGWTAYTPATDAVTAGEGTFTIRVEYRDRAGNTLLLGGDIDIDLFAPTTTALGIPVGVASAPVTVTLSATDAVAGVNKTFYRLDEGPIETYLAPFQVSAEGSTTVAFWSVDALGHVESPKTKLVRIDTTAPIGTFVLDGDAAYSLTQTVTADSAFTEAGQMRFDTGSGFGPWVAYADTYDLGLSGEGTHTVLAHYRDAVGNVREMQDEIFVDLAVPQASASLETTGWSPGPVTVTLAGTDSGSGIASIHYRIGSVTEQYTGPFEVAAEGETLVEFWVVDRAGRHSATGTTTVRIDTIAPAGSVRLARGARYSTVRTVRLDSSIDGATEMSIDVGAGFAPWASYVESTQVTLPGEGSQTVTVRFRDLAGNEIERSATVIVDTLAPTLSGVMVTVDSWRRPKQPTGSVKATWTASDASPVVGYSWIIDRTATTPADTVIDTTSTKIATTVPVHGTWYLHVRAKDAAGNWSATRTVRFEVTSRHTRGRVFR